MTTLTTTQTPPHRRTRPGRSVRMARIAAIARWVVRVLLAAQFLAGGLLKLTADPTMVAMFADMGAAPALRLFVGACEVAGAAGLLVPRLSRVAAYGLVLLMVGAAVTNLVALQTSPVLPLVLGALAAATTVTTRTATDTATQEGDPR